MGWCQGNWPRRQHRSCSTWQCTPHHASPPPERGNVSTGTDKINLREENVSTDKFDEETVLSRPWQNIGGDKYSGHFPWLQVISIFITTVIHGHIGFVLHLLTLNSRLSGWGSPAPPVLLHAPVTWSVLISFSCFSCIPRSFYRQVSEDHYKSLHLSNCEFAL